MKKIFFITLILLLTGCSQDRDIENTIDSSDIMSTEEDLYSSLKSMSVEDMILNYLDGDWVDYNESTHQYLYIVKSIDEIYSTTNAQPYKITREEFLQLIENDEWEKDNIVITDQGFNVDIGNGFVEKYSFDTSKIIDGDISNIILHKDMYFEGDYSYGVDYVRPGKEYVQKDPEIGMTHDEVIESTWGKPNDINKTTYEWGTTEQWCYYNRRYIYFENGLVTAIQE